MTNEQALNIHVRALSKKYGSQVVLHNVNLSVRAGEVYALTGPNGAGKTTLIRCIAGLVFPSQGTVELDGKNSFTQGTAARAQLGAVVEAPAAFYKHLTGRENLIAHGKLAAQAPNSNPVSAERIREVLHLLELERMADQPVYEFSLGQRQRLGVASAILAKPKVLILDEPTSGLDPLGIGLIHRILASVAADGGSVLLSTHHLREVASYAHTVGILNRGEMVDRIDLRAWQNTFKFRVDEPTRAAVALQTLPHIERAYARGTYVVAHLRSEADIPSCVTKLVQEQHQVWEVSLDQFDLYDYYRDRVEMF